MIVNHLGYANCLFSPASGCSGGHCICFKQRITVEPIHIDKNTITVIYYSLPVTCPWMCSFIYDHSYHPPKPTFWRKLATMVGSFPGPWLGIDDLNEALSIEEKEGGRLFNPSSSSGLSYIMMTQGLLDLGYNGSKSTWANKWEGPTDIKERLDKRIANTQWRELFPKANLINLPTFASDHGSILLNTNGETYRKPKQFQFEEMWLRHPTCREVIRSTWNRISWGSPMFKLCCKLKEVKGTLKKWNREVFGHIQTRIKGFFQELETTQRCEPTMENL